MKYTTDEALTQILSRGERLRQGRARRDVRVLSGTATVLFAALVLAVAVLPKQAATFSAGSVYGSFLLEQAAGGYVLAGVIAFVLGVAVTLLCLRLRARGTSPAPQEEKPAYMHLQDNALAGVTGGKNIPEQKPESPKEESKQKNKEMY